MAIKLSVYRDGGLYCQVDVTALGLRLGRGPENEVILEDPQKRVSRSHAEIRVEGHNFILIDLGSANGTFVEGRQITRHELRPGIPFTVGPYRLMLEESADAETAPSGYTDYQNATGTMLPPDAGPSSIQEPMPEEPVLPPPLPGRGQQPRRGETTRLAFDTLSKHWKLVAGMLVAGALVGGAAFVGLRSSGPETVAGEPSMAEVPVDSASEDDNARDIRLARELLATGDREKAAEALRDHIEPVLSRDPANAEAVDLKREAEARVAAADVEQTPPPAAPAPVATPPPGQVRPGPRPPPDPDVSMRPREDEGTYRSRVAEIRRLLDSARADVEGRRFDSALATLKEVESRTAPTDEARRRAQAIAVQVAERRQQAADDLVAAGERAQAAGELLRAYEDFSKARDMGVAGMDQRLAQLRVAMARQGELALSEARNHDASGDLAKAIRAYERAFDYLPSEDPRREQARRRLVELRGR